MSKVQFKPRTSKPEEGNLYYTRKANGGYNNAVKGKPTDKCDVLANCVGYSYGRFNEVSKQDGCTLLAAVMPGAFPDYADGCETGTEPKVGAVIVWVSEGLNGHVGNVEAIIDENTIVTSESHYGGSAFDLNIRQKVDGKFFFKDGYTFKCFIYNPNLTSTEDKIATLEKKVTSLNKSIETYKTKLTEQTNKVNDYSDTISSNNQTIEELRKTISSLTAKTSIINSLSTDIEYFQSLSEDYKQTCDKLEAKCNELKTENETLTNKLNNLTIVDIIRILFGKRE